MRARIVLPSAFPPRWEGEKRNKEYRWIPDVSFQEVEGHKKILFLSGFLM
jgi:hypothetical protein